MAAAYDNYNYTSFWVGREYEHKSEVVAIRAFLHKIHKIKTILDIGGGYGRLTPNYLFRAKKAILSDPSSQLLKIARDTFKGEKKLNYVHATLSSLPTKIKRHSVDVVLMVRVVHHITNMDAAFEDINKLLKPNGYLILEYANKRHLKATVKELLAGNFMFPFDITPIDIRSEANKKGKTIPFLNYHPDTINSLLEKYGYQVIEKRSVSNIRSPFLKSILPVDFLVSIDKITQSLLSGIAFGPSIFILARKRG